MKCGVIHVQPLRGFMTNQSTTQSRDTDPYF